MHLTVDKNDGKMARKYVEIGDNEKHPHYKMLPGDLHPVYSDHTYLREDPFDGDNGKHPDYDLLPDDLHPVYAEHVYLPEDPFEGIYDDVHKTTEVQHNDAITNVENILESSSQSNPEAMKGNGIHSEIQSQSNLHDPAQKIHATAIASPSKQKEEKQHRSKGFWAHNGKQYIHNMAGGGGGTWIKANKPNFKTPHSPKLQWKPRSDVSGEDI
ncbi:hypothetical protein PGT21_010082 [Puccinia graminis f. sp. tritici]|uniref:Uncharacterized protein n=1 Tax=Puccinia graminis f. sp. tritici TaxID=56615 RepID=A0A5B0NBW3_PUCGR|nr:hypothetical protein PGT21_010082 [Puccinia graminis f. sp. tritici]